uniref:Uncharacterized protein LOC113793767 n=1 Tax=Dermatophagoides pteronyssinus TaxID=6956 RepID=A0A6P6Y2Z9_DERPT|nr:uncharacterized protein LOC113793767 [Dermatophagoides pteronyssinus]
MIYFDFQNKMTLKNSLILFYMFTIITFQLYYLPMANASSFSLTRDDCADLYSMIGAIGQQQQQQTENAIDIIRRITQHRLDGDSLVRLYDLCLRSEEGIRYRRSLRPSSSSSILPSLLSTKNNWKLLDRNNMGKQQHFSIIPSSSSSIDHSDQSSIETDAYIPLRTKQQQQH